MSLASSRLVIQLATMKSRGDFQARLSAANLLTGWIPPFVAGRIRTQVLRMAGVSIGKSSIFWGQPVLVGTGDVGKRLRVGTNCGFNKGCLFGLEDSITIGDHVSVGHDVMFLTRAERRGTTALGAAEWSVGPITIGSGSWLGARCTICPGVTIGVSSVIGAGVIVTHDVPANTLCTGAPPISLARWR